MDREEEKDFYIKAKLKEKNDIPKKIDDLFNHSIELLKDKGGDFMEETNQKTKSENKTKKKQTIVKKLIPIAACAVIILGGGNIYATTKGYDNIFFMIKEWVTGTTTTIGKDEILSDRDITISYKQIQILENLKITVKKLQIKDGIATLFLDVDETGELDSTVVPLKYKIYANDKLLSEKTSAKKNTSEKNYTENITIENYKEEKILNLEIDKSNGEKITTIQIDLEQKTLNVQGEKEQLNKISEIELKKFLGYEASMEIIYSEDCRDKEGTKILAVEEFLQDKELMKDYHLNKKDFYAVVEANLAEEVAREVFAENIGTLPKNGIYASYKEGGVKYYGMEAGSDISLNGTCIDISDVSYCSGIYTTTFTYVHLPSVPDYDINDCTIYQNTVHFKYDENHKYSKFIVVSKEEPVVIKKATEKEEGVVEDKNITISDFDKEIMNNSNSKPNYAQTNSASTSNVNNYASTMSWSDYWAPGLRFKYPTIFELEELGGNNRGSMPGEMTTRITGLAQGINPDTKEIINSNLTIKIYEPQMIQGGTIYREYANFSATTNSKRTSLV